MTDAEKAIVASARRQLDEDPHFAVYMVRDLECTKARCLDNMAWSMCGNGASRVEVRWLLDQLEANEVQP